MIGPARMLLLSGSSAHAAYPRLSRFTVESLGVTNVVDQPYGVSITSTAAALLLLGTGLTDARVDAQFYLSGFDGQVSHQFGIVMRGARSGGNLTGYLPSVRFNSDADVSGGQNFGQTRAFSGVAGNSNEVDAGNTVLPGAGYETGLIHLAAEIVGTAWQQKAWIDTEPEPDWQQGDADITRTFTDTVIYHATGDFGVGMNIVDPDVTVHLTSLLVRPITALS